MNLKDRMKSGSQDSKLTGIESSTIQELKKPSREKALLDQAMARITNLQSEIEQTKLEDREKIQHLSSENSSLRKELQRKSEMIVSLNGQIEKLHGSDIILKQNEQLVRQNKELQRNAQDAREEAAAMILTVKRDYTVRLRALDNQIQEAVQRENIARDMEVSYKEKVVEEAKRITEKARASAEQEYRLRAAEAENGYKIKRKAVYGITIGSLLYCLLATVLTACNSMRIRADFSAFVSFLWTFTTEPVWMATEACKTVWSVKEIIPVQVLNVAIAVILVILVFLLIVGLIYGSIGFTIYEAGVFYHVKFWDLISCAVALSSMGILVWFADALTWFPWNLVLVWMVIHGGYILIRMIVSSRQNSR